MTTVFEIRLKSIKLMENGAIDTNEGSNALGASLFYPRPGTPGVNSVRAMNLHDNIGLLFSGKPYDQQVLFKEAVQGKTLLTLEVSAIEKPSRLDKVVSGLVGTAVSVAVGGAGSAIFGAVAKSLSGSIFDAIGPKKKVAVIARGSLEFSEDDFPNGGEVTVPFHVPKTIKIRDLKLKNGEPDRSELTLQKNSPNGRIVLEFHRLPT